MAFTPKEFASFPRFRNLTDLGFVVVQMDGMGTAGRSKAFHDVCWHDLKDAGFPDRILWHQAAAAKYPWYDATRVGVYGTSAGGQNAAGAVIFHGDFYTAAYAACGHLGRLRPGPRRGQEPRREDQHHPQRRPDRHRQVLAGPYLGYVERDR